MSDRIGIYLHNQLGSITVGTFRPGWVKAYDPEANDGRGLIAVTPHATEAKVYPSMEAARREYLAIPACRPTRAEDGGKNRPLTAFTVSLEHLP